MKGTHRIDPEARNNVAMLKPGDYVFRSGAGWYACTPNGHLANLSAHDCTYADGVLTVSPSIKVSGHQVVDGVRVSDEVVELWHGYLEHGVWRAC